MIENEDKIFEWMCLNVAQCWGSYIDLSDAALLEFYIDKSILSLDEIEEYHLLAIEALRRSYM